MVLDDSHVEESETPVVVEDLHTQLDPLHISPSVLSSQQEQQQDLLHHVSTITSNHIQKQCIYLILLLIALGTVEQVTPKASSSWLVVLQRHEPSVRIFRALSEMGLLLLCTAGCVAVWCRYLGVEETERLLFYMPYSDESPMGGISQDDDDDVFDEVHEDDLFTDYKDATPNSDEPQDSSKHHVPSPVALFSTVLDLFLWILVTLFLYAVAAAEAATEDSEWHLLSRIAAPTFPLILFLYAAFRAIYPFSKRAVIFQVLSFTLWAPSYSVSFRDGMIGDILTSTVRPLQDIAFTTCYILFGLKGWWSSSYFALSDANFVEAADASVPAMERSWLLHTLILPACMISPLWYRFLQNMRQVYDEKRRWPYLGNAWKYFCAAQVAMVGVYHPHVKSNPIWLLCFALATLYQIWWDVVMDWGLLASDGTLRQRRLYPRTSVYYGLTIINALLRFCWTLNFVPTRYLSAAGVLMRDGSVAAPVIASAEIIRRSLWALLRVEWESVKDKGDPESMKDGMIPMNLPGTKRRGGFLGDMNSMADTEVLGELCLYTSTFAMLGLIIAAHRGTM